MNYSSIFDVKYYSGGDKKNCNFGKLQFFHYYDEGNNS
jgi:hypothetical protein